MSGSILITQLFNALMMSKGALAEAPLNKNSSGDYPDLPV